MLSPERYRKATYQQQSNYNEFQNSSMQSQQAPMIDALHANREKKWFFDQVEAQGTEFNPFGVGAPGSGAPLRNDKNEVVYKLPNLEDNLWRAASRQQSPSKQQLQDRRTPIDNKREEIHRIIDDLTTQQKRPTLQATDFGYSQQALNFARPKRQQVAQRETYWNDWFGRPGAGAPNWDTRKQNLEQMLEPRIITARNGNYYDPTVSFKTTGRDRYKSDHHNSYEYVHI